MIVLNDVNPGLVIGIVVGAVAILIALFILLYIFVFSRNAMKRQIRDLEGRYSYLDALLIGQDSQYIHRLESISHANLLYLDKYNDFSKRFKDIYENDDKYTESMIKQLNSLIANKQYKNIKSVISDTRRTLAAFEDSVNALDADLRAVIKPEEDERHAILIVKEKFRRVKQIFYSNSNDLELVTTSFTKVFDKLEQSFDTFEKHIECAEYEEAHAIVEKVKGVVDALAEALEELPNLCIILEKVLPEKIDNLIKDYELVEKQGVPLYNLSFHRRVSEWESRLDAIKFNLVNLKTRGAAEGLDAIEVEINDIKTNLNKEMTDKTSFEETSEVLYKKTIELEKAFLKVSSILPDVRVAYVINPNQEENLNTLKEKMDTLGNSKRHLDSFIHSGTRQPFSVLREKLDDLNHDYESALQSFKAFKDYLTSLKTSTEEAFELVFVYFYRCKQIETILKETYLEEFPKNYEGELDETYLLLNEIDNLLKTKPINVVLVNEKVESLKMRANNFFEEVENRCREQQLAESAVVYANRDRNHQNDVHQQLSILEQSFFQGEFSKVYHEASNIFSRMHVEEGNNDTHGN